MTSPRRPVAPTHACLAVLLAGMLPLLAGAAARAGVDPTSWSRYGDWEVSDFKVTGVPKDLAGTLDAGLQYTGRRRLLQGLVRPPFRATGLADDVRRIVLFLAAHGYPAADVDAVLVPDPEARRVAVTLRVTPGSKVVVATVTLEGWPEDVPRPGRGDPVLPRRGERFVDARVRLASLHLARLLRESGYAEVKVALQLRQARTDAVDLVYAITPGDRYVIAHVEATGCDPGLRPLARRIIDMPPGTRYRASMMDDAALDLRATQLFASVDLTATPSAPGELTVTAKLADARWRTWTASVGSWSDNPWRVRAGWNHTNLFGRGRGLRASGTYATHERRVGVDVYQLGWLAPRAVTTLGGEWIREEEEAYRSDEFTARVLQAFRPRGRGLWQLGVGISRIAVTGLTGDPTLPLDSQDWLLEVYADRKWDWTDDLLYPTRGGYLKLSATWAPAAAFFGASYVQTQADVAGYLGLGGLANGEARLGVGWSRPLGSNDELLANRRFYAGGYNTMRGYRRHRLGPRDAEGKPRGGQAELLAGAELRRHLVWILDAAVFLDSGNVWATPGDMRLGDLLSAAGADLDVRTPLGPLRVGHAWNLGPVVPGGPRTLWHFGIGYPW